LRFATFAIAARCLLTTASAHELQAAGGTTRLAGRRRLAAGPGPPRCWFPCPREPSHLRGSRSVERPIDEAACAWAQAAWPAAAMSASAVVVMRSKRAGAVAAVRVMFGAPGWPRSCRVTDLIVDAEEHPGGGGISLRSSRRRFGAQAESPAWTPAGAGVSRAPREQVCGAVRCGGDDRLRRGLGCVSCRRSQGEREAPGQGDSRGEPDLDHEPESSRPPARRDGHGPRGCRGAEAWRPGRRCGSRHDHEHLVIDWERDVHGEGEVLPATRHVVRPQRGTGRDPRGWQCDVQWHDDLHRRHRCLPRRDGTPHVHRRQLE
jgi:hypothetical protein